ncbi:cysteine--tRNA ligase [Candidatus Nomurabacteria bacterium]|nr:cysteine--tRNA ligase [Candidatus Nomurabacteria bacterium]
MKILLNNTLSKKKEEFRPIKKGQVGLYTCGPTVYSYPHLGNLRAYIVWDVLKRFLDSEGLKVKHIMNLTDVGHLTSDADSGEDKLEKAAKKEGKNAWEIADFFIQVFKDNLKELNILPPSKFVRATKTIKEQIKFVQILEKKGFLYQTSDGLYFDTSKISDYGKLANIQNIDLQEGARVEKNKEKKNITDFAVWKFSPLDFQRDMEWNSPWGKGFPGWHLECSVMSQMYLGDTFDIHTGGVDHLPIHHPNEMAQSEAATGKLQAHYWMHNEFLKFKDGKMSKSAGTTFDLTDLEKKNISPLAFRYFVLQAHYRKSLNFSWEALEAAQTGLVNIVRDITGRKLGKKVNQKYLEKFQKSLSDDLNTPQALAVLQELLADDQIEDGEKMATIYKMDEILGLDLKNLVKKSLTFSNEEKNLLKQRQVARVNKDWNLSDQLRDQLKEIGIEVEDTKDGQKATRVNL